MFDDYFEQGPSSGSSDTILCERCNITFKQKKNLYAHMRNVHSGIVILTGNQHCGMCSESFHKMSDLHKHLEQQHNVALSFSDVTFYSKEDFLEWKTNFEKENQSSFVIRGATTKEGVTFSYYVCHRSGICKLKEKRERLLKKKGSIKIGFTCPAFINVVSETVDDVTEIKVHYQSIHVGHEMEIERLPKVKKKILTSSVHIEHDIEVGRPTKDKKGTLSSTTHVGREMEVEKIPKVKKRALASIHVGQEMEVGRLCKVKKVAVASSIEVGHEVEVERVPKEGKGTLESPLGLEIPKLTSTTAPIIHKCHKDSPKTASHYNVTRKDNKILLKKPESSKVKYEIRLGNHYGCSIQCEKCNICIHSMQCSCLDYGVKFLIYKHTDFICQENGIQPEVPNESTGEDNLLIHQAKNRRELEKTASTSYLERNNNEVTEHLKKKVMHKLEELQKRLIDCESDKILEYAEEKINSFNAYLDASTCLMSLPEKLPEITHASVNNNINRQKDFDLNKNRKILNIIKKN